MPKIIQRGPAANDAAPARTFALIPFDKIKLDTTPAYLVKGIVPRVGLSVIWGPPKCGKSFLTFDLMMHVALGWEYRGRRVRQGAVVYCALEGAHGFRARVEAFRRESLPRRCVDRSVQPNGSAQAGRGSSGLDCGRSTSLGQEAPSPS